MLDAGTGARISSLCPDIFSRSRPIASPLDRRNQAGRREGRLRYVTISSTKALLLPNTAQVYTRMRVTITELDNAVPPSKEMVRLENVAPCRGFAIAPWCSWYRSSFRTMPATVKPTLSLGSSRGKIYRALEMTYQMPTKRSALKGTAPMLRTKPPNTAPPLSWVELARARSIQGRKRTRCPSTPRAK